MVGQLKAVTAKGDFSPISFLDIMLGPRKFSLPGVGDKTDHKAHFKLAEMAIDALQQLVDLGQCCCLGMCMLY